MKKYNDKRIEIYVNSLIPLGDGNNYGVANFPEKDKMPLDAVKKIKKIIDNYLNLSDVGTLYIATYSTGVISFIHDYGKLKKYKVQIFYKDKKIGINGVLKKFNSVFRYIDKVCHKEIK